MIERPLRFCFVTTFYPPYSFGGDGIAVRRLANALAEREHHVEIVHCVDAFRTLQPSDVPSATDYSDHPAIVHHGLQSRAGFLSPLITQQTALSQVLQQRGECPVEERQQEVLEHVEVVLVRVPMAGTLGLGVDRDEGHTSLDQPPR